MTTLPGFLICMMSLLMPAAVRSGIVDQTEIAKSGETTIHAKVANEQVDIVFRVARLENGTPAFPVVEWNPRAVSIIAVMHISVHGKEIFVPRSVFADLLDPRLARITFQKPDFVLELTGGDGAETYFVRAYFDANRVKMRRLYSSLTPSTAAEETQYRLSVLKDQ